MKLILLARVLKILTKETDMSRTGSTKVLGACVCECPYLIGLGQEDRPWR